MRIWFKFLLGAALGLALGFLLPAGSSKLIAVLEELYKLCVAVGAYAAIPVLFFSLTVGAYELRRDGRFWRNLGRVLLVTLIGGALLIALGLAVAYFVPTKRIPIIGETTAAVPMPDGWAAVREIFPQDMFAALLTKDGCVAPLCVFACIIAAGMAYDKTFSKPAVLLFDSLSRVFYHIAAFFTEIMGALTIALAAYWAVQYRGVIAGGIYTSALILLGAVAGVLAFVIMPLAVYLTKPGSKVLPWWALVNGALAPAIAGFFSGSVNFCLPLVFRHLKENLGVRRRSNALSVGFLAIFGRCGSALTAGIAMLIIINSYSSLGITWQELLVIAGETLAVSFLLMKNQAGGAWTALALLCAWDNGRGFQSAYLILKPIAFYLIAVGALLDAVFMFFAAYLAGVWSGYQEERETKKTI
jgi:Na+/H+-dicarboxylate symporter